jgi:hypothetical protein
MLQQLREDGLIEIGSRHARVLDAAGLKKVGGFDADYLHLARTEKGREGVSERVGDLI